MKSVRNLIAQFWETDAPLTGASLLMLAAFVFSLVGLAIDPRTVTGMPAWLKPAKFAISTAIFMLTLAWVFTYLPSWIRMRRLVGRVTAALLVLEVAIIDLQAWRDTTSHFNTSTPLDGFLFSVMGIAIFVQTLMSVLVTIALWRQSFTDRALGWALRLGLAITILGASTGGLMVTPTRAQLDEARATHRLPIAGSHTVGAPDGGPGFPGTGWSLQYGDLRVPHFLGLHAWQLLPLVVWAAARRGLSQAKHVRLTFVIAASYFSLFVLLLWQALRAQSFVQPDGRMLIALMCWAVFSAATAWIATTRTEAPRTQAIVN